MGRGRGRGVGRDDRPIGLGEVEGGKLGGQDPTEGAVFVGVGSGAGGREPADKGKQFDVHVAVVVDEAREGANDEGVAAEFLAEFAEQSGFRRLAGLELAAGEFPFEREVFVRGALGDENATCGVFDDGTGDRQGRFNHHGADERGEERRAQSRARGLAAISAAGGGGQAEGKGKSRS